MEGNQRLPLFVVEFGVFGVALRILGIIDFDALVFNHDEAGVNALDFGDKLLLRYWPRLWLLDQLG